MISKKLLAKHFDSKRQKACKNPWDRDSTKQTVKKLAYRGVLIYHLNPHWNSKAPRKANPAQTSKMRKVLERWFLSWCSSVVATHLHDVHGAVKEDEWGFSEPWVYPAVSQLSANGVVASQLMFSWNRLHAIYLHLTQLQPIHEILCRSNLGDMETKRQNLKRALDDYLLEFNACHCGPCQNNGEPVLVGDTCFCQCRPGYRGPACEQTKRQGKMHVPTAGGGQKAAKGQDFPLHG